MNRSHITFKRQPEPEPPPAPKKESSPKGESKGPDYGAQARQAQTFRDFASAFASIGHPIYPDDLCGRLLAYAALSNSEDCVCYAPLNCAILVAQDTFNIKGGEIPHMEKMVYWQRAMQDLRDTGTKSEWWPAFAERYSIDPKRWPILDKAFQENFVYFKGPMTSRKIGRLREDDEPGTETGEVAVSRMVRLRGDEDDEGPCIVCGGPEPCSHDFDKMGTQPLNTCAKTRLRE